MAKKIIMSLGMLVFVGVVVVGATGAFFSDTETSTGNTFTAGAIDLRVDSEAHYNGNVCVPNPTGGSDPAYVWFGDSSYPVPGSQCNGTWELTDLGPTHQFFNYSDIKPGDEGENTISLHIDNNPAWACIDVSVTKNDDVSSTEPELDVLGEVAEDNTNAMDGELAQNVNFAAWLDQGKIEGWQGATADPEEGDNKWEGQVYEPLLFSNQSGPASDVLGGKTYPLADSNIGLGPILPLQTNYIGLQWCAGTQVVDVPSSTITCDGSTLGNIIQTDSMEASITFRVEQARNNDNFTCLPPTSESQQP